jgi:hypothetical protein
MWIHGGKAAAAPDFGAGFVDWLAGDWRRFVCSFL